MKYLQLCFCGCCSCGQNSQPQLQHGMEMIKNAFESGGKNFSLALTMNLSLKQFFRNFSEKEKQFS